MDAPPDHLRTALVDLLLSVADDKLMLGHRNSDWTGLAPILEEDIAFSSIAQDEMAHALALYELDAELSGTTPDSLVYERTPETFRCCELATLSDGFDWAQAIARQFFCDHFDLRRLEWLSGSAWTTLATLARRLQAEERVHVDHVDLWMRRLGRGGDESKQRLQDALQRLAPTAGMLTEPCADQALLEAEGLLPTMERDPFDRWHDDLAAVCDDAGLVLDLPRPDPGITGGRRGVHGEVLGELLDEMREVYRLEPAAQW